MRLVSKNFLYFFVCIILIACSTESDEEKAEDEFQASSKTLINTGLITSETYSSDNRTICVGILQNGDITSTAATSLKEDDVLAFSGQQEFVLVEEAPTDGREDCIYVERGYGGTNPVPIEISATIYRVKTLSPEAK